MPFHCEVYRLKIILVKKKSDLTSSNGCNVNDRKWLDVWASFENVLFKQHFNDGISIN